MSFLVDSATKRRDSVEDKEERKAVVVAVAEVAEAGVIIDFGVSILNVEKLRWVGPADTEDEKLRGLENKIP